MKKLPIIVNMERASEDTPTWRVSTWFAHECDSFPSAIVATFNARAAIKDTDYTHWGEK